METRDPSRPLVAPPTTSDGVPVGVLRSYPYWLAILAREGKVSARAVMLWAEIASLFRHGRRQCCDASQAYLAERLPPVKGRPVSVRSIERYLAELEAAGAVTIRRRAGWSNEYVPHLEPKTDTLPLFVDRPAAAAESAGESGSASPSSVVSRTPADTPDASVGGLPTGPSTQVSGKAERNREESREGNPPADLFEIAEELLPEGAVGSFARSLAREADRLPGGRAALQELRERGLRRTLAYWLPALRGKAAEIQQKELDRPQAEHVFDGEERRRELEAIAAGEEKTPADSASSLESVTALVRAVSASMPTAGQAAENLRRNMGLG